MRGSIHNVSRYCSTVTLNALTPRLCQNPPKICQYLGWIVALTQNTLEVWEAKWKLLGNMNPIYCLNFARDLTTWTYWMTPFSWNQFWSRNEKYQIQIWQRYPQQCPSSRRFRGVGSVRPVVSWGEDHISANGNDFVRSFDKRSECGW